MDENRAKVEAEMELQIEEIHLKECVGFYAMCWFYYVQGLVLFH